MPHWYKHKHMWFGKAQFHRLCPSHLPCIGFYKWFTQQYKYIAPLRYCMQELIHGSNGPMDNGHTFNSEGIGYLKHAEWPFIFSDRTDQDFSGDGSPGTATNQYSFSDMLRQTLLLLVFQQNKRGCTQTCDDHATVRPQTGYSRKCWVS